MVLGKAPLVKNSPNISDINATQQAILCENSPWNDESHSLISGVKQSKMVVLSIIFLMNVRSNSEKPKIILLSMGASRFTLFPMEKKYFLPSILERLPEEYFTTKVVRVWKITRRSSTLQRILLSDEKVRMIGIRNIMEFIFMI